jgi:dipeptidyl aminopeptidase/acylaminoacyl peptidase
MSTPQSRRSLGLGAVCLLALVALAAPVVARQGSPTATPRVLTAADYARAEKFLAAATTPLVFGLTVQPTWLADGRFWYRNTTAGGAETILIDPAGKRRIVCSADQPDCKSAGVPIGAAAPEAGGRGRAGGGGGRGGGAGNPAQSPDGKRTAFIKDFNLWVRDVTTGQETQLTTDGVKDFGYATNNAGWTKSDAPVLAWSPDSKRIATFQHDGRGVGEMYLVSTSVGHPTLQAWKYPLPGDDNIFMIERVVIDVDTKKVTRLLMPPDPHRSSLCDHVVCGGGWADVQWSPDSRQVAFLSTSRDHKQEWLRVADAGSGEVRQVLHEKVDTFFESGNGRVNWRYLPASNEFIWFSERDNWGHLYLYDAASGRLKNPITTGEGNVTQMLRVDEKNRVIYFLGIGKEKGRDPYFRHFYRVDFDGRNQKLLTLDDADHTVTLSPGGEYFVDTWSKPDVPPVSTLRDSSGQLVVALEKADISKLVASGWKPPLPIAMKARDGVTDIYGLLFRPTNFDLSKKYPIVNQIYPGPQSGSVGSRSFSAARGDTQALAELGFIVVQIDGMGTPGRSKKFHEAYFANMGDNTLPDQVAGMRELGKRFPWIDLDRVGIWGHSGGGYATADAMFRYPDFFKVGISESGNHDNRNYEDDWAEKWQGLLLKNPDGTTNYDNQANQLQAKNLKGKLLLAHGTLDSNVPPSNTLLVVDELIKANKDFDLLMIPNAGHGFGAAGNYMMRRRWDYFVRHLLGAEPPKDYQIGR